LPLHPHRRGALFDVTRLIHHQRRLPVPEMLYHIGPQVIPGTVGIPGRPRQQVLHPARVVIARVLGNGPAILAGQPGHQAQDERPRSPPRLHPAKPAPDPQHQLIEHAQPPAGAYAVASGHRQVVMCPHKP